MPIEPVVEIGDVRVYQLLSGRDFAAENAIAVQMANYVYALVPKFDTAAVVLVDPCYDIGGIAAAARSVGGTAIGSAVFTHHHPDHVGGRFGGARLEGLREILKLPEGPKCSIGELDVPRAARQCDVDPALIHPLCEGDAVLVGPNAALEVLHTPGHTDGSLCFRLRSKAVPLVDGSAVSEDAVFTGDTLFIGSCGRWRDNRSLRHLVMSLDRLATLPDSTIVLPGHNYASPTSSTIDVERRENDMVLQAIDAAPRLRKLAESHPGILSPAAATGGSTSRRKAASGLGTTYSIAAYVGAARGQLCLHTRGIDGGGACDGTCTPVNSASHL